MLRESGSTCTVAIVLCNPSQSGLRGVGPASVCYLLAANLTAKTMDANALPGFAWTASRFKMMKNHIADTCGHLRIRDQEISASNALARLDPTVFGGQRHASGR